MDWQGWGVFVAVLGALAIHARWLDGRFEKRIANSAEAVKAYIGASAARIEERIAESAENIKEYVTGVEARIEKRIMESGRGCQGACCGVRGAPQGSGPDRDRGSREGERRAAGRAGRQD